MSAIPPPEPPASQPPPVTLRWLAGTTLVIALMASAACVFIDLRTPADTVGVRVLFSEAGFWYIPEAAVLTASAAVALHHDVQNRIGWILGGFGLFWALDALSQSWVRFGVRTDELLPASQLALWFVDRFGAFLPIGIPLLFLLYPTGRFPAGPWGRAGRGCVALYCVTAALFVVGPGREVSRSDLLPAGLALNPTALPLDAASVRVVLQVLSILVVVSLVVPIRTVVSRYRHSLGDARDRMRWLLWGLISEAIVLAVAMLAAASVREVIFSAVVAVPAIAVTIGLVRPQLVPIDALLGTTIVYGVLGVTVLGVDLAVLATLTSLLGSALEQRQVVVLILLVTAGFYGPMREWLRRLTRRLVFGQRDDRYDLVAGLASRLERAADPDDQLAAVAAVVARAFGVSYVSVEVDRSRSERVVASHGARPTETRSLPIAYRGDVVGRLVLPAHGVRANLSPRDEQLLGDLVRQAATAARTSRLAEQLQESRERLVLAREEERRRIRRDLHDGLGPALSGVVFRVETARMQLPPDIDPDAGRTLVLAREDVQQVIADVRRLVNDLRPPALDDLGLVGAVRQQAETASAGGVRVSVAAEGVAVLPAAVEVAAYRIIGEAMTNALRHARATNCDVTMSVAGDDLRISVVDDGDGIRADAVSGVGLESLRERAAELGGSSEVTCPRSGGTSVVATLPLRTRA